MTTDLAITRRLPDHESIPFLNELAEEWNAPFTDELVSIISQAFAQKAGATASLEIAGANTDRSAARSVPEMAAAAVLT